MSSIPGFSSLSDETLNQGPKTILQDKLLKRIYYDKAGYYAVPNVLSPRDLVFSPDLSDINWTIIMVWFVCMFPGVPCSRTFKLNCWPVLIKVYM